VTASNHIPSEAGPVALRRPPCPVSAPAREGRGSADATGANRPPPFPAEDQVVTLALPHAFLSGTTRSALDLFARARPAPGGPQVRP
jgi:hypothetical protein